VSQTTLCPQRVRFRAVVGHSPAALYGFLAGLYRLIVLEASDFLLLGLLGRPSAPPRGVPPQTPLPLGFPFSSALSDKRLKLLCFPLVGLFSLSRGLGNILFCLASFISRAVGARMALFLAKVYPSVLRAEKPWLFITARAFSFSTSLSTSCTRTPHTRPCWKLRKLHSQSSISPAPSAGCSSALRVG